MSNLALPTQMGPKPALLIVDLISDFEFEDGEILFDRSQAMIDELSQIKTELRTREIPVIYVNDELEESNGDIVKDIAHLRARSDRADSVLSRLLPTEDDHFVFKPQRSGFYATTLGNLLMSLEVTSVIVTGVTTDICVFFTAHDAYMRGYGVWVPENCCVAVEDSFHHDALSFIARVADADTTPLKLTTSRTSPLDIHPPVTLEGVSYSL